MKLYRFLLITYILVQPIIILSSHGKRPKTTETLNDTQRRLQNAINSGNAQAVRTIIQNNPEHIRRLAQQSGSSLLTTATDLGNSEVILALTNAGFNPNQPNAKGQLPLEMAIINADPNAVNILTAGNANVNIQNRQGQFPLHAAAEWGQVDATTLEALIENGVNLMLEDNQGHIAAEIAPFDSYLSYRTELQAQEQGRTDIVRRIRNRFN